MFPACRSQIFSAVLDPRLYGVFSYVSHHESVEFSRGIHTLASFFSVAFSRFRGVLALFPLFDF